MLFAVFWGGREGFQTLLNTNVYKELSHMAAFFRMAVGKGFIGAQYHNPFVVSYTAFLSSLPISAILLSCPHS